MESLQNQLCTICGEEKTAGQVWFLIAESHWEDKLRVLHWHDGLAKRSGVHRACCPAHVQELVAYWMTLGSLDHLCNMAVTTVGAAERRVRPTLPILTEPDTGEARQIGELAVDRESLDRALNENPGSLQILLDELLDTLEREVSDTAARLESGSELPSGMLRQV